MIGETPFPVDAFIAALAADGIRAAHKPYPLDLAACIEELKLQPPGDWLPCAPRWIEAEMALLCAIPRRHENAPHHAFAVGIVDRFDGSVFRTRKLLEIDDAQHGRWTIEEGDTILEQLKPRCTHALDACARPIKFRMTSCEHDKLSLLATQRYEPLYENSGFTSGVSGFLAGMLPRVDTPLDAEDTKHMLLFSDGILIDFERGIVRNATATDRLQRYVPRPFASTIGDKDMGLMVAMLLKEHYRETKYLKHPSSSDIVVDALALMANHWPLLGFLRDASGPQPDWDFVVYLLLLAVGTVTGANNMDLAWITGRCGN
jgi:hypothetical protein